MTDSAAEAQGILELYPDGYGFVRGISTQCEPKPGDAYVPASLIRQFELRGGMIVAGPAKHVQLNGNGKNQKNGRNQRGRGNQRKRQDKPQGPRLADVTLIEGQAPDECRHLPIFDQLTPIDPRQWLRLETATDRLTTRVMDMFTPIGKGTRGLIVAPPRTGKTILLQHIAEAITQNHPECELMVLLVDERPEEVTEMTRTLTGAKVFASSNDRDSNSHVRIARLVTERAKRLAEMGKDVVVLLDSITRLARAHNREVGSTGRTMSGGLDVKALDVPKKLFGTARAFDEGGSLTILGTALIETGSRMDDVIFQEFKGTGNMELVLDRKLADRRIFPAIDIFQSGTRKEERLLPAENLDRITLLRRTMASLNPIDMMEKLLFQLKKFDTNAEFLESISRFSR